MGVSLVFLIFLARLELLPCLRQEEFGNVGLADGRLVRALVQLACHVRPLEHHGRERRCLPLLGAQEHAAFVTVFLRVEPGEVAFIDHEVVPEGGFKRVCARSHDRHFHPVDAGDLLGKFG